MERLLSLEGQISPKKFRLDCGYRGKTLRRHVSTRHGLGPDELSGNDFSGYFGRSFWPAPSG
jgi:hypothetical protein